MTAGLVGLLGRERGTEVSLACLDECDSLMRLCAPRRRSAP